MRSFDDVIALEGRWPADPAWGAAYTLLPEWVGVWYDDISLFADHYDGIKQHIDQLGRYAAANNASGLLTYGLYSDWCPPQGQHTPKIDFRKKPFESNSLLLGHNFIFFFVSYAYPTPPLIPQS